MSLFSRLVKPRLPPAAVGLAGEGASVVALDKRREVFTIRRAGFVPFAEGLLRPNFDESNLADVAELAATLGELAASTGLQKRKRWSVTLPEAATRSAIITVEAGAGSRGEAEEMLRWKTERAFGAPADELRVARHRLPADAEGRDRYLAAAVRLAVLAEYEAAFEALGWQAGLVLPRHMGEAWWLMRDRSPGDALVVSGHAEGFTAVLLRAGRPLFVRSIACDAEDRADELYRFLLFYRDRAQSPGDEEADAPAGVIEQLLVAGQGVDARQAGTIIEETLQARPRVVEASDVRLSLPSAELSFAQLAAPAGLAALAWG